MEDRTNVNRSVGGISLTVQQIRGLLTRLAHDLVRTLNEAGNAGAVPAEAQPLDTRRYVISMSRFLRMN